MKHPRIRELRAKVVGGAGASVKSDAKSHWIDDQVATPLSKYPEYRASRSSWGKDRMTRVIVEAEDDDGRIGIGVTTGGPPAAWIIENQFAPLIEGRRVGEIDQCWDVMWGASLFYGRKGLAVHAISAVDLALWDLWGRVRGEPVHELLGGAIRHALPCYATGPDSGRARELGFTGSKVLLRHAPVEGRRGLRANLKRLEEARVAGGDNLDLMLDCWMSLDLDYAKRLIDAASEVGLHWIEEPFPPDEYLSYAQFRKYVSGRTRVAAGEHEAGLHGFTLLLQLGCVDIVQPDIQWCGGLTELLRIAVVAESFGVPLVPHSTNAYTQHFQATQRGEQVVEFLMMHPTGSEPLPILKNVFSSEAVPKQGVIAVSNQPGFGVELAPDIELHRPFIKGDVVR